MKDNEELDVFSTAMRDKQMLAGSHVHLWST